MESGETTTAGSAETTTLESERLPANESAIYDRVVDLGASVENATARASERNYAWPLRWDDGRNATEFEQAFADYLDARGDRVGERRWRDDGVQFGLRRVSDDTVVVLFGSSRVVRGAEFSGGNSTVTVQVPSG